MTETRQAKVRVQRPSGAQWPGGFVVFAAGAGLRVRSRIAGDAEAGLAGRRGNSA